MTTGLAALAATIGPLAGRDGVWFDALVGGLSHDEYEGLVGDHETLEYDRASGELRWAKVIWFDGGSLTVETAYEAVGRQAA